MSIVLDDIQLYSVHIATRMPFRYGIATLTEVPYLIVAAEVTVDGAAVRGMAADVLPPKWFTKHADTPLDAEIAEMLAVIRQARSHALAVGAAETVFDFWVRLDAAQSAWGAETGLPPLLSGFGTSLVERSLIDAFCRAKGIPFIEALRSGTLGLRLGKIHPELEGLSATDLLPAPTQRLRVRHTVGLADPMTDAAIPDEERLCDGLPQSLEACVRTYGLTYFKLKIPADADAARARLSEIASVITSNCPEFAFTLDGNEGFQDVAALRTCWQALHDDPTIAAFMEQGLLLVEQPLHRNVALDDSVARALKKWDARPPIIIDESDGDAASVRRALDCHYAGVSHKNCKGVFRGIANACLLAARQRRRTGLAYHLTGEDLMNIGPVALLQDLAAAAALGVRHIERNGHHYVKGLSAFPQAVQGAVLRAHPELYRQAGTNGSGFAALHIDKGEIDASGVLEAPFGYDFDLDCSGFEKVSHTNGA